MSTRHKLSFTFTSVQPTPSPSPYCCPYPSPYRTLRSPPPPQNPAGDGPSLERLAILDEPRADGGAHGLLAAGAAPRSAPEGPAGTSRGRGGWGLSVSATRSPSPPSLLVPLPVSLLYTLPHATRCEGCVLSALYTFDSVLYSRDTGRGNSREGGGEEGRGKRQSRPGTTLDELAVEQGDLTYTRVKRRARAGPHGALRGTARGRARRGSPRSLSGNCAPSTAPARRRSPPSAQRASPPSQCQCPAAGAHR